MKIKGIKGVKGYKSIKNRKTLNKEVFRNNVEGIYLPDLKDSVDRGHLFQDSTGTIPVTGVEQPVGLILEGSKGVELGPELVTNGAFDEDVSGWDNDGSFSWDNGVARDDNTNSGYGLAQEISTSQGKTYLIEFEINEIIGGTPSVYFGTSSDVIKIYSSNGIKRLIVKAIFDDSLIGFKGANANFTIDNISVREVLGNHLNQPTDADRPILSAKVNGLTDTEDFSADSWLKEDGATVTGQNVLNFPETEARVRQTWITNAPVGTTVTGSIVLSGTGSIRVKVFRAYGGGDFELSLINVDLTSTPTRYEVEHTIINEGQIGFTLEIRKASASTATEVTATQVDLRYVDQATDLLPDYQYVGDVDTDPTDYDWGDFPWYLAFNGVNTWMYIPNMTPNSDEVFVCAGVRKVSDNGTRILFEYTESSNGIINFRFLAPSNGGSNSYRFYSKWTYESGAYAGTGGFAPAPDTAVIRGVAKIGSDTCELFRNNSLIGSSPGDQGTGTYANETLYIGSRGGTSLFFTGNIYSLILAFKIPNNRIINRAERLVNKNTKAYV